MNQLLLPAVATSPQYTSKDRLTAPALLEAANKEFEMLESIISKVKMQNLPESNSWLINKMFEVTYKYGLPYWESFCNYLKNFKGDQGLKQLTYINELLWKYLEKAASGRDVSGLKLIALASEIIAKIEGASSTLGIILDGENGEKDVRLQTFKLVKTLQEVRGASELTQRLHSQFYITLDVESIMPLSDSYQLRDGKSGKTLSSPDELANAVKDLLIKLANEGKVVASDESTSEADGKEEQSVWVKSDQNAQDVKDETVKTEDEFPSGFTFINAIQFKKVDDRLQIIATNSNDKLPTRIVLQEFTIVQKYQLITEPDIQTAIAAMKNHKPNIADSKMGIVEVREISTEEVLQVISLLKKELGITSTNENIQYLSSGAYSVAFKITLDGKEYVIKLPKKSVSQIQEEANSALVHNLGLAKREIDLLRSHYQDNLSSVVPIIGEGFVEYTYQGKTFQAYLMKYIPYSLEIVQDEATKKKVLKLVLELLANDIYIDPTFAKTWRYITSLRVDKEGNVYLIDAGVTAASEASSTDAKFWPRGALNLMATQPHILSGESLYLYDALKGLCIELGYTSLNDALEALDLNINLVGGTKTFTELDNFAMQLAQKQKAEKEDVRMQAERIILNLLKKESFSELGTADAIKFVDSSLNILTEKCASDPDSSIVNEWLQYFQSSYIAGFNVPSVNLLHSTVENLRTLKNYLNAIDQSTWKINDILGFVAKLLQDKAEALQVYEIYIKSNI